MSVEIVHWNPVRPKYSGRVGRRLPITGPVNNFGDLIGPMLVERILQSRGLDPRRTAASGPRRLLTVGSILHFAEPGDVVWGSGINGKAFEVPLATDLDVRSVRGPLTRDRLTAAGLAVPEVYGDPALLWPHFWDRAHYLGTDRPSGTVVVPNLHDWRAMRRDPRVVSPRLPVHDVIARIARAELVVGSSLHGVVLAESMGIPARFVRAHAEPAFKYEDYLRGTGRSDFEPGSSVEEAVALGGQAPAAIATEALLDAFPEDLWRRP